MSIETRYIFRSSCNRSQSLLLGTHEAKGREQGNFAKDRKEVNRYRTETAETGEGSKGRRVEGKKGRGGLWKSCGGREEVTRDGTGRDETGQAIEKASRRRPAFERGGNIKGGGQKGIYTVDVIKEVTPK